MVWIETIAPHFDKYHLNGEGEHPWPFRPVLHHMKFPDLSDAHDHPWDFTTHILRGSYIEEIYDRHGRLTAVEHRLEGHSYSLPAEHIHRIVSLPEGECWTLVIAGPARRDVLFYEVVD